MKNRGAALIEILIVLAVAIMLFVLIGGCIHNEKVEMPKAYQAWIKQTGNTNKLTYDEWRSLLRANKKQNDTIILIPMSYGR